MLEDAFGTGLVLLDEIIEPDNRASQSSLGHVAKLADALALGASGVIRVGSSPSVPTG